MSVMVRDMAMILDSHQVTSTSYMLWLVLRTSQPRKWPDSRRRRQVPSVCEVLTSGSKAAANLLLQEKQSIRPASKFDGAHLGAAVSPVACEGDSELTFVQRVVAPTKVCFCCQRIHQG